MAAFDHLKTSIQSRKALPSVIFLRYQLLDCSGHNLVGHLRKLPGFEKTPIVFLTSPSGEAEFFHGPLPAGATIVYEKLITPETFSEIEELLQHAAQGGT